MPYDTLKELPDAVRDNPPKHAQEIYQAAYNNAWEEYKDEEDRQDDKSREETAHSIAWAALKNAYYKNENGKWVKK